MTGDRRPGFPLPGLPAMRRTEPLIAPGLGIWLLTGRIRALYYRVGFIRFWHPAQIVALSIETLARYSDRCGTTPRGNGQDRHKRPLYGQIPQIGPLSTFPVSAIEKSVDNAAIGAYIWGMTREQLVAIVMTLLMGQEKADLPVPKPTLGEFVSTALQIVQAAEKAVAQEKGA